METQAIAPVSRISYSVLVSWPTHPGTGYRWLSVVVADRANLVAQKAAKIARDHGVAPQRVEIYEYPTHTRVGAEPLATFELSEAS